ncbi:hypothetical protein [Ponticaulis sp.]|uniref:hypothetical protein n=1 Tax=Ponticaulis sp. TaxID=2020902 RepID=UPI000C56BB04|nr:hypothetical protein [Ponticaulis sp.]MAF58128.1 hypothetical protein [Ponticaulis sp.]MBN05314.1 hypothetical protein [Ponticaulis sp.]|tara:strand:+ start:425 stop:928 length:504 start_codon:yes stop_codon:yes gene_type:complete
MNSVAADWLDRVLNAALTVLVIVSVAVAIENPEKLGFEPRPERPSVRTVMAAIEHGRKCLSVYEQYEYFNACQQAGSESGGSLVSCPEDVPPETAVPATLASAQIFAATQLSQMELLACPPPEEMARQLNSAREAVERVNSRRETGLSHVEEILSRRNTSEGAGPDK